MSPLRSRRAGMLAVVAAWGLFQNVYRLGAADWVGDELTYRFAGWSYAHGDFTRNFDHPFIGKLLLGLGQLVFGRGQAQTRLLPALATLATGWLVFVLLEYEVGFPAALGGLGGWLLLPHSALGLPVRIDRFGLLEPILTLFVTATLVTGWRWARTGKWGWALATGLLGGLAVSTKVTGVLVLPVVALTVLAVRRSSVAVSQVLGCAVVTQLTVVSSYAIIGARGADAARYMIERQADHHSVGHLVRVAGTDYLDPPWWAHLWFQTQSYGLIGTVAIAALALLGLVYGGALGRYLTAVVATFVVVLGVGVGFALPFYYLVWQPALMALAGIGGGVLWRNGIRARLVAVTFAAPLLVLAGSTTGDLLHLQPVGYDLLASTDLPSVARRPDGHVLVLGDRDLVAAQLDVHQLVLTKVLPGRRVDAVIVDCAFARRYPRSDVLQYLADRPGGFEVTRVADLLLHLPSAHDVGPAPTCAAESDGPATDSS